MGLLQQKIVPCLLSQLNISQHVSHVITIIIVIHKNKIEYVIGQNI